MRCLLFNLPQGFKTEFHYNKDWNEFASSFRDKGAKTLRPNSITTRIETNATLVFTDKTGNFKTEFHYNKDWNLFLWR